MSLNNIILHPDYRSDSSDIVRDFYLPCLSNSIEYRRAVGYFTSSGLVAASKGLSAFIKGNGKMLLVANPFFQENDIDAMKRGYAAREDIIEQALIREIAQNPETKPTQGINLLSWLISEERLDVRIALPVDQSGTPRNGIYHEKLGIFIDELSNVVAFSGSANETYGGLVDNFESIDVFWSWGETGDRVARKIEYFDLLWRNKTRGLQLFEFPQAAKKALLKTYNPTTNIHSNGDKIAEIDVDYTPDSLEESNEIQIPAGIKLRDYQLEALRKWEAASYRGIMNMATGTGKTITALAALTEVIQRQKQIVILISCPNTHLVLQWEKEAKLFGFKPVLAYSSRKKWTEKLNREIARYKRNSTDIVMVITTNSTLAAKSDTLQRMLGKVNGSELCFIADEAHNLGAYTTRQRLADIYGYRLGLTATPTRYFDDAGSKFLFKYLGESIIEVSLSYAIENNFLSRYNYYPHVVFLNDEETIEYSRLTKQIQKLSYLLTDESVDDSKLQRLLEKRVALLNNAEEKNAVIGELLDSMETLEKTLFYCTDKQIDDLCEYLISRGFFIKRVTYKDAALERQKIFKEFENDIVQALVAIGVLDEGLDIPSTQIAFILASTGNPKQFIQRRGRVLRKPPSGEKLAIIHDFIAIPNESASEESHVKHALERELRRFKEFASTSENSIEAQATVWNIALKYGLVAEV